MASGPPGSRPSRHRQAIHIRLINSARFLTYIPNLYLSWALTALLLLLVFLLLLFVWSIGKDYFCLLLCAPFGVFPLTFVKIPFPVCANSLCPVMGWLALLPLLCVVHIVRSTLCGAVISGPPV